MPEFAEAVLAAEVVYENFARMPERRMAQVVAHGDGVGEFGVEAEEAGDGAADGNDVVHMFDPGADAVVIGVEKDLGLGFEAGIGRGMQDSPVVAVELAADFIGFERGGCLAADSLFPMGMPWAHGFAGKGVAVFLDVGFQGVCIL